MNYFAGAITTDDGLCELALVDSSDRLVEQRVLSAPYRSQCERLRPLMERADAVFVLQSGRWEDVAGSLLGAGARVVPVRLSWLEQYRSLVVSRRELSDAVRLARLCWLDPGMDGVVYRRDVRSTSERLQMRAELMPYWD